MIASPENVRTLGQGLDHPECVCVGEDGSIYAGGEAGQIYRICSDGTSQTQLASTGGFLLGIALDGERCLHVCDVARAAVLRIDPDGKIIERSTGTAEQRMVVPNYPIFDRDGNLYVSDSGEYWSQEGTGCIYVIRPNGKTELFHAGPLRFANGLAISPDQNWLYIVQSTASNIVRISLARSQGPIEVTHTLPPRTVPDGIAFAADGTLIIGCYKPDTVFLGHPDGTVDALIEDHTGELLSRPTNVAVGAGELFISNLGGWHIAAIDTDMKPAPIHRPILK